MDDEPVDWIRAKLVLKKVQLCFKALLTQDPFDPICLGFEVRIRENELGLIKGFRLDSLEVEDLPSLSPPSLGF